MPESALFRTDKQGDNEPSAHVLLPSASITMRRSSLRRPESLTDKYRILGKIGEGTYGMVFKAEAYSNALLPRPSASGGSNSSSNAAGAIAGGANNAATVDEEEPLTFAIKLVKSHKEGKNDVVLSSATVREIKLLRELHHDNVVHLHDVHLDPREKMLALVFEYADHDLHDIIVQSKQKPLSEYARKSLMYQILKGVDYMHDAWVMHRDMKPQNILVVGHGRKRGQVKLAGTCTTMRVIVRACLLLINACFIYCISL